MYTMNGTFAEVAAFITGHASCASGSPLFGDGWRAFNSYVNWRVGFPDKMAWTTSIYDCCEAESEAIGLFLELIIAFVAIAEERTHDDIILEYSAAAPAPDRPESPEAALRDFFRVVWFGRRADIEPLIAPNQMASVLWLGSYPREVAERLSSQAGRMRIGRLHSSDPDRIVLNCEHHQAITTVRHDSRWLVDATPLIDTWKRSLSGSTPPGKTERQS